MREKMRDHLEARVEAQEFDVKQGAGGITDLEFLVQYLVLRFAPEYPDLTVYTDNIRIIEQAGHLGLLTDLQTEQLISAYIAERQVIHQLALDDRGNVTRQNLAKHRHAVISAWQAWLGD